jgi:hypothetical protein
MIGKGDDRLAAVLFVERMRPVEVLLVEEADVFAPKDLRTDDRPDPVVDRIAGDGRNGEQPEQPCDVHRSARREGARGEQQ